MEEGDCDGDDNDGDDQRRHLKVDNGDQWMVLMMIKMTSIMIPKGAYTLWTRAHKAWERGGIHKDAFKASQNIRKGNLSTLIKKRSIL